MAHACRYADRRPVLLLPPRAPTAAVQQPARNAQPRGDGDAGSELRGRAYSLLNVTGLQQAVRPEYHHPALDTSQPAAAPHRATAGGPAAAQVHPAPSAAACLMQHRVDLVPILHVELRRERRVASRKGASHTSEKKSGQRCRALSWPTQVQWNAPSQASAPREDAPRRRETRWLPDPPTHGCSRLRRSGGDATR